MLSRVQKIPALKSLLLTPQAPSAPQTPEQQWTIFTSMAAAQSNRMH